MNHAQALLDYEALHEIAGGQPHDAGEELESIALEILRKPSAKEAKKHLCELIEMYFSRGGPEGGSLLDNTIAREIFARHHLVTDEREARFAGQSMAGASTLGRKR